MAAPNGPPPPSNPAMTHLSPPPSTHHSPFPVLATRPPPLTKATYLPASLPAVSPADRDDISSSPSTICPNSIPVLMAATSSPPSSPYISTELTSGNSSAPPTRKCPSLWPIAALPASTGAAALPMMPPPFLYQFSPTHQQLMPVAAAMAQHPTIASICTLHPSGLIGAAMFPFANQMAATYGVLVDAPPPSSSSPSPSNNKSPLMAREDGSASPSPSPSSSTPFIVEKNMSSVVKVEAPAVSSTQPLLRNARPSSLRGGGAQVLASIPSDEYTPAFSELKQFAEEFKTRRIRLGYTQGAVGQSLADRGYSNFAQSTISRFEQLQLSPTNAAAIKQILERWLQEAESPQSNPCDSGEIMGAGGCRKRKKRAVFTPQTKAMLEDHFAFNPRPNRATIEMLSGKLDLLPEEIRVWFCNKRQKIKQSGSDGCPASSTGNWCRSKVLSTSSRGGSGSTSPSQMSCSDGRCRNTPSPKTSFTIEELSKSSIVTTPSSGTSSPSLSSPLDIFSTYDISPTLAAPRGAFSSVPFFVSKLLVSPPATQAI